MALATRRTLLAGGLAAASTLLMRHGGADAAGTGGQPHMLAIDDRSGGLPINPWIYGSNEHGTMDGAAPSITYDAACNVPVRRLGGNLMTTYNWVNNASNAGKDWKHENGLILPGVLGLTPEQASAPAAVISAMHMNSLKIGASSLITLPLAGYVAADADGAVSERETAPSPRFLPVLWQSARSAGEAPRRDAVDIPQLLRRLVALFGRADAGGIRGYYLDNEPGLWFETHPRIMPKKPTIASLIERSLLAARTIKTIDPTALVIGPASWGATEYRTFQDAPDWANFSGHGSFLAAYLDAFSKASDEAGLRLLDGLDIHWYPQYRKETLFRTGDPRLADAVLQAPRSLSERGFREESWVADVLPVGASSGGLGLPILPSLAGLIASRFPGTGLSVGEFNFGAPGEVASGLAVADALGRMGATGVGLANHWGNLDGYIGEAYRLYRDYDGRGSSFGDHTLPVSGGNPAILSAFAARHRDRLTVVLINKAESAETVSISLASGPSGPKAIHGFDKLTKVGAGLTLPRSGGSPEALLLPPRSARLLVY